MDFTREPIIETVITPKEGCKLVVRSSKSPGQEEYFVDAVEVVSFGNALFLRSTERPKSFLVPATDYEILEVREARMVLKNVGMDRSIKIGGGREAKASKEVAEKPSVSAEEEPAAEEEPVLVEGKAEGRFEKKRDRRRHSRKKRGREEAAKEEVPAETGLEPSEEEGQAAGEETRIELPPPKREGEQPGVTILPPPTTLISESIARYKDNVLYKGAFYNREEEQSSAVSAEEGPFGEAEEGGTVGAVEGFEGIFDVSEEVEEDIHRHRIRQPISEEEESERGFEPTNSKSQSHEEKPIE